MAWSVRGLVGSVSILVAAVGCVEAEEEGGSDEETFVDGKADGISSFKLKLTKSGSTLRAKETPKLAGAPTGTTGFTCTEGRTADGWRLACSRGSERLTVMYGAPERAGAIVYVKTTSSPDRRNYYTCTSTAAVSADWPGELTCTAKQPKTNIGGQLVSPFASSIADTGILNSHLVATSGSAKIYRGMKPFRPADIADLKDLGIGAVLIFKKPTGTNEVADEVAALGPIGVPASRVVNIEFPWKDFPDFEEPCRMTVRALKQIKTWSAAGKSTFFHCTVGEDRTGYLAGVYRLLTETTATPWSMFDQEMCERGYSAGNPQKPLAGVVREVDNDLTPIYMKMAFKIAKGELTPTSLNEDVCATDPEDDPAFDDAQWDATKFRCSSSTRYRL